MKHKLLTALLCIALVSAPAGSFGAPLQTDLLPGQEISAENADAPGGTETEDPPADPDHEEEPESPEENPGETDPPPLATPTPEPSATEAPVTGIPVTDATDKPEPTAPAETPDSALPGDEAPETGGQEDGSMQEITENTGDEKTDVENASEILVLDPDNVGQVEADSEETEELLEEIGDGEIIALSPLPAQVRDAAEPAALSSEGGVSRAASGKYKLVDLGKIYCDEVWTRENSEKGIRNSTSNYRLEYVDADGNLVQTPAYCIEASEASIMDNTTGSEAQIRDEAVKTLTNTTMKKLLYFGWGGPGNACGRYDPTCRHIAWNARNQYVFTHIALSKVYSGQVGNATEEELEHTGINRFLAYISGLSLPSHNAVSLQVTDVEGARESGRSIQADLKVLRNAGERFPYLWEAYRRECRMTNTITVSDTNAANGIRITRKASDSWQLLYWISTADYQERGTANPRIGPEDGTVELKNTARFVLVFPSGQNQKITFRFPAILRPVSYLWLDADVQTGQSSFQDYGFVTYEGAYGYAELTVEPLPMGSLLLAKTCRQDVQAVEGAQYTLYAAETLSSGKSTYFKKDAAVDTGITDSRGNCRFTSLIPGRYYVKETKAPEGYDLDPARYDVTVNANDTSAAAETVVSVQDDRSRPELCRITVTKKIRADDITWAHGNPTFFFCVEGTDIRGQKRKYEDHVCFTRDNLETDGDGFAVMSVTFSQIPEGTYRIYERKTLRYYLKEASADNGNLTVRTGEEPRYGTDPADIAYGEARLEKDTPFAGITFVNEKQRYDGYSHTSVIRNRIPLFPEA